MKRELTESKGFQKLKRVVYRFYKQGQAHSIRAEQRDIPTSKRVRQAEKRIENQANGGWNNKSRVLKESLN